MNSHSMKMLIAAAVAGLALATARAAEKSNSISIQHTPVTWAVKGQPLTLKARVTGGVGGVENVTLYYALFRDAAPFRVTMTPSGLDMYVGTIEAGLLTGLGTVSYYIEAQDKEGTLEETPWYDVQFKNPDVAPVGRTSPANGGAVAPSASGGKSDEGSSATLGLIAGGAAAIAIGAYVISDSDSGGSDDDGGTSPQNAGVYDGDATTCLTIPPQSTVCSNNSIQIIIDSAGNVFSDSLLPGQSLFGKMSGDSFSLSGSVSDSSTNFTGTIVFDGTVVNGRSIAGVISGSVNANGTPGSYSGTFTANKKE